MCAITQASSGMDFAIPWFNHPDSMTPKRYAGDTCAKSCNVADVFDESTLGIITTEVDESYIYYSLRGYCFSNQQANLTGVAIEAPSLLAI